MGSQCISLLYGNGERTLDLTCKDKMQAEIWFVGMRAIISRTHHHRIVDPLKSNRRAHSSISSRAGYTWRKQNLGLSAKTIRPSQVKSLERLCETRNDKIQESQQKVEEAWSVVKEEASKSRAAKEIVKALTSRISWDLHVFRKMFIKHRVKPTVDERNSYMIGTVPEQFMGSLLLMKVVWSSV